MITPEEAFNMKKQELVDGIAVAEQTMSSVTAGEQKAFLKRLAILKAELRRRDETKQYKKKTKELVDACKILISSGKYAADPDIGRIRRMLNAFENPDET